MHIAPLIQDLTLILTVASVTVLIFHRIRQPVVLGYIVAGVLVSGVLGGSGSTPGSWIRDQQSISTFAELGVIFLMFSLGLEFSFRKVLKLGATPAIIGLFETGLMIAAGWGIGHLLGRPPLESLFLGAMTAISSTTIIVKVLEETGLKHRRFAQTVLGVLLIEDLVAILLLVSLGTLTTTGTTSARVLAETLGTLILVVGGWFLSGYLLLPRLMKHVGRTRSDEILVITSIGLCLLLGVLGTKYHFSTALGAFIMGSILAESTESDRIEDLVRPLRDLFVAIFFVSIGMLLDPGTILAHWDVILALSIWVIAAKFIAVTAGSILAGKSLQSSALIGSSFTQIGEFSFILAGLGVTSRSISPTLTPIIVSVSVLTTLLTPLLIQSAPRISDRLKNLLPLKLQLGIDRYSRWVESRQSSPSSADIAGPDTLRWLIAGFVVTMGSRIGVTQGIPRATTSGLLPEGLAAPVTGVITAVLLLPFLWRFLRGISRQQADAAPVHKLRLRLSQLVALLISGILGLPFFKATPVALGVALAAIVLTVRLFKPLASLYGFLEKSFSATFEHQAKSGAPSHMRRLAPWEHQLVRVKVSPDSEFAGKTILDCALRKDHGINIIAIQRGSRMIVTPDPLQQLFPKDELLVLGTEARLEAIRERIEGSESTPPPIDQLDNYELRSVRIPENSPLGGKSLRELDFRGIYGVLVTGIERADKRILNPESDTPLIPLDLVWMVGEDQRLQNVVDAIAVQGTADPMVRQEE